MEEICKNCKWMKRYLYRRDTKLCRCQYNPPVVVAHIGGDQDGFITEVQSERPDVDEYDFCSRFEAKNKGNDDV